MQKAGGTASTAPPQRCLARVRQMAAQDKAPGPAPAPGAGEKIAPLQAAAAGALDAAEGGTAEQATPDLGTIKTAERAIFLHNPYESGGRRRGALPRQIDARPLDRVSEHLERPGKIAVGGGGMRWPSGAPGANDKAPAHRPPAIRSLQARVLSGWKRAGWQPKRSESTQRGSAMRANRGRTRSRMQGSLTGACGARQGAAAIREGKRGKSSDHDARRGAASYWTASAAGSANPKACGRGVAHMTGLALAGSHRGAATPRPPLSPSSDAPHPVRMPPLPS